jgi:hypothetical protein
MMLKWLFASVVLYGGLVALLYVAQVLTTRLSRSSNFRSVETIASRLLKS